MKRPTHADGDRDEMPTGTGTAVVVVGEAAPRTPRAVLWVPDIEQRYGWREYWVYPPDDKPGRRLGFR